MDCTHIARDDTDRQNDTCEPDDCTLYFVLMNSREYGTEVWPCSSLDEALETLSRLARSAELHRRTDHIQRYFCILGELPALEQNIVCDTVTPNLPDADALTLVIHLRERHRYSEAGLCTSRHCCGKETSLEEVAA